MAEPTRVFVARRILTLNPGQPEATHVAVRDGRILAVGDAEAAQAWGPAELDRRFAGQVLLPGFVEGHCHLKEGGMWAWPYLGWFDRMDPEGRTWPGLRSTDALLQRLNQLDAELASAPPITLADGRQLPAPLVAWGFDPIYLAGQRLTARDLDRVGDGRRPILIAHANAHLITCNSALLAAAGITEDTDVHGVMKDAQGQPDGELQEPAAMYLVLRCIGPVGMAAPLDDAGLQAFARLARRAGVTTATDMVNRLGPGDVAALQAATNRDDWPLRIVPAYQAFHGPAGAEAGAAHVQALQAQSTERLRFGLVKMMLDGSIQGFSARLRWPGYFRHPRGEAPAGQPLRNGIWVVSPAQYEADFEVYHRAGLTIHTHTNGDEASAVAIDAIGRVLARAPRPGHRHTLQHGQMIDRAQFRQMAALGLGANLFANHIWYWGEQHRALTMGPDRAERLDACRSALDAGVPLAIHSDAPVTPLAPLFTAWCAVNRLTPEGRVLGPAERISVHEALHAITLGAAHTLGLDGEIGSIECGKRADFTVLDDDPTRIDPMALKDLQVQATVLGGRVFTPD